MKTSISLIKKLARLGVLDTETIKYKKDTDITIENTNGEVVRVLTDNVTDEELPLMIATEQLATLKSIRSMVKFFTIFTVVCIAIWVIVLLIQLGW